jgi:hypothetical protein
MLVLCVTDGVFRPLAKAEDGPREWRGSRGVALTVLGRGVMFESLLGRGKVPGLAGVCDSAEDLSETGGDGGV